jgi:hypothetical protein
MAAVGAAADATHTWPPSVDRNVTDTLRSFLCLGRLGGPLDPSEPYMATAAPDSVCASQRWPTKLLVTSCKAFAARSDQHETICMLYSSVHWPQSSS